MNATRLAFVLSITLIGVNGWPALAAEPPMIPVGLDAYRLWERWPHQRIGARAYMRSTYDRRGGNEGADASHFLYQLADDFNVTLDVAGPGVLYFVRCNHWHGSPWHYEVDGVDHIVQETSTANPNQPAPNSVFLPEHLFPNPLTWTWSITKGADLMWVPIPFERTFRLAYSRTRYGTGYYIYHLYDRSAKLSQPIRSWEGKTPPDKDVLELIGRAGTDIVPPSDGLRARELTGDGRELITQLFTRGPAMLRSIEISAPRKDAVALGRGRIRMTWDDRPHASVDAPIALFFGAGTLYNRDEREYLVKAFPMNIRFDSNRVHLACYFPMPYFESAKIELIDTVPDTRLKVRYLPVNDPPEHLGYFHATYRDHPHPEPGRDLVLLDTRETEGGGDWSGSFVGTSWIFSHRAVLATLEGDPRFFFDDSQTPQAYGTGTEEWGGGGDYWGGLNMTLPFAGHPCGARNAREAKNDHDKIQSAYRFLLADLMPFGKNAVIRLEHGGHNESTEHYETVAYWYGVNSPSLIKTDELKIGDAASEKAHSYLSPDASEPYEITSRYEWGVDTLNIVQNPAEDRPLAEPKDFAEFEFQAEADRTYYIWARGKNLDGSHTSDAFWLQFDEEIGTDRLGASHGHAKGFGNWLDRFPSGSYAWSSALPQDPPQTVSFRRSGAHRLRLQPRHPKHELEAIWLSSSQKVLPEPAHTPSPQPGEIVLQATNAARMSGQIKLVADKTSATGKVLEIGGGRATISKVIYEPHTDRGRKTKGTSEFTLKLKSENFGVLLRRKLDYSFHNQRAEVFVADAGTVEPDWQLAGIWYLAGGNTCIYSNPPEELGAAQHNLQTSNRRFRDDEFLVPRELTRGRAAIRVRVKFTPVPIPLFPGHPLSELAWSEIRYDAYCYVMPEVKRPSSERR